MEKFDEKHSVSRKKTTDNKNNKNKQQDWLVAISAAQLVLACVGTILLLAVAIESSSFDNRKYIAHLNTFSFLDIKKFAPF